MHLIKIQLLVTMTKLKHKESRANSCSMHLTSMFDFFESGLISQMTLFLGETIGLVLTFFQQYCQFKYDPFIPLGTG